MHFALDAIQRFPSLTCLALHHVELHHSRGAIYRFPIQLNTLDLHLHRSSVEDFFKNLLSMDTIPVFSHFIFLASPQHQTHSRGSICVTSAIVFAASVSICAAYISVAPASKSCNSAQVADILTFRPSHFLQIPFFLKSFPPFTAPTSPT
ncbi:hypothetical protein C8F04DRAFT_245450 [Mycena alexandri]|uniref:Uncharacterized protein n=1 Tax=Mycena alexandri TaxID=1745969 RepID=A0AAD6S734_9AGAR|nr:hypothetical protein C8F04DRAFT_245450 [Mycena alexandri]